MIKARARLGASRQDTIFLGLDRENIRRLLDNQPIMFDGVEVGIPGVRFVILAGETLDDVREDLRSIGVIPRRCGAVSPSGQRCPLPDDGHPHGNAVEAQ